MLKRVATACGLVWLMACGDGGGEEMETEEVSTQDAGTDSASPRADAQTDSDVDSGCDCSDPAEPVCLADTQQCVQCADDDLSACPQERPFCGAGNRCVACRGAEDCAEETPICGDDGCRVCETDGECGDGLICDTGRCVECASGRTEACESEEAAFACDVVLGRCSAEELGSAEVCEPCVSDAHCGEGLHCVPMAFEGSDIGSFCQKARAAGEGCEERPYQTERTKVTTLEGTKGDICTLAPNVTCASLTSYGQPCGVDENGAPVAEGRPGDAVAGDDALCGAPDLDDGFCINAGGSAIGANYKCTTRCGDTMLLTQPAESPGAICRELEPNAFSCLVPDDGQCPAVPSELNSDSLVRCIMFAEGPGCGF